MYRVTFNKEPDGRFWMENRAVDEQFDPHSFFNLPTALEVFQPTLPKILKRRPEMIASNQQIQIQVQNQLGQILRITCQVLFNLHF